jgi:hypothetical protein
LIWLFYMFFQSIKRHVENRDVYVTSVFIFCRSCKVFPESASPTLAVPAEKCQGTAGSSTRACISVTAKQNNIAFPSHQKFFIMIHWYRIHSLHFGFSQVQPWFISWNRGSHSGDQEKYYLLGRDTVYFGTLSCCLLLPGCSLGLLFDP